MSQVTTVKCHWETHYSSMFLPPEEKSFTTRMQSVTWCLPCKNFKTPLQSTIVDEYGAPRSNRGAKGRHQAWEPQPEQRYYTVWILMNRKGRREACLANKGSFREWLSANVTSRRKPLKEELDTPTEIRPQEIFTLVKWSQALILGASLGSRMASSKTSHPFEITPCSSTDAPLLSPVIYGFLDCKHAISLFDSWDPTLQSR